MVKRYEPQTIHYFGSDGMDQSEYGDWVAFTDYKQLQQENAELKATVEVLRSTVSDLLPELIPPIEITWHDCYGAQSCKYCHEGLGNKLARAEEHRESCPSIPANIAKAVLNNTRAQNLAEIEARAVEKLNFPTMLRKMWSGSEVQQWLTDTAQQLRENS